MTRLGPSLTRPPGRDVPPPPDPEDIDPAEVAVLAANLAGVLDGLTATANRLTLERDDALDIAQAAVALLESRARAAGRAPSLAVQELRVRLYGAEDAAEGIAAGPDHVNEGPALRVVPDGRDDP